MKRTRSSIGWTWGEPHAARRVHVRPSTAMGKEGTVHRCDPSPFSRLSFPGRVRCTSSSHVLGMVGQRSQERSLVHLEHVSHQLLLVLSIVEGQHPIPLLPSEHFLEVFLLSFVVPPRDGSYFFVHFDGGDVLGYESHVHDEESEDADGEGGVQDEHEEHQCDFGGIFLLDGSGEASHELRHEHPSGEDARRGGVSQEEEERLGVVRADAVGHPHAVVVHPQDALVAHRAVVGSFRLPGLALPAVPRPGMIRSIELASFDGAHGRFDVFHRSPSVRHGSRVRVGRGEVAPHQESHQHVVGDQGHVPRRFVRHPFSPSVEDRHVVVARHQRQHQEHHGASQATQVSAVAEQVHAHESGGFASILCIRGRRGWSGHAASRAREPAHQVSRARAPGGLGRWTEVDPKGPIAGPEQPTVRSIATRDWRGRHRVDRPPIPCEDGARGPIKGRERGGGPQLLLRVCE
eukprot:scaffold690_cov327-Pavlova_lutheri.AAC.17